MYDPKKFVTFKIKFLESIMPKVGDVIRYIWGYSIHDSYKNIKETELEGSDEAMVRHDMDKLICKISFEDGIKLKHNPCLYKKYESSGKDKKIRELTKKEDLYYTRYECELNNIKHGETYIIRWTYAPK
jgi:hypothetical protein